jgi:hypothetical protein
MSALTSRPGTGARRSRKWLTIALFLLPGLALYLTFVIGPIIQAAHFSLFRWNGLTPLTDFIGLKNYQAAFASSVFWQALGNNVFVIVLSLALQIPFSLGLAVLLNRRFPGRAVFRLLFFVPYVLTTLNLYFVAMRFRKYSPKGIWLASALSFSTFWIYMKAGAVAVLGLKRAFGVTPKGVGGAIPVRRLAVVSLKNGSPRPDTIQILASLFHPDGVNDIAPSGYDWIEFPRDLEPSPLDPRPEPTGMRRRT